MKHVHKTDQVIHLWAHQAQASARTTRNNSRTGAFGYGYNRTGGAPTCSFSGPVLYSYSTPIAMLHKAGKVALITSQKFSVTTAKQQNAARHAASRLTAFTVPFIGHKASNGRGWSQPKNWRALNRDYLAKQYADEVSRLERSLRGPYCSEGVGFGSVVFTELSGYRVTLDQYCSAFGLKAPRLDVAGGAARIVAARGATWAKHEAAVTAKRDRDRAMYDRLRAEREAEERLTYAEKVAKFRAGERVNFGWGTPRAEGALLRLAGDTVETSQGAEVPAADAARAAAFVARVRKSGKAWQRNGEQFPVGQFQLDSVSETGDVRAGCHLILWDEVVRLHAALTAAEG